MNGKDFDLDQPVMVYERDNRKVNYYPGKITRIGRTLVDVTYKRSDDYEVTDKFRMDTQRRTGESFGWGPPSFLTMEQYEESRRRAAAIRILDEAKVRVHEANLSLEQLEAIAAVLTQSPAPQAQD